MNSDRTSEALHIEQLSWMFFATLRRMSRSLDVHSRHLEKEFGLTVPQLNVLWAVGTSGRAPIGQVADRISLSGATLTSIVDRLEQHGLVERERSTNDKRQVLIALTDSGRRVLARGPKPFHECFEQRLARMEHWRQTELLSAAQHVAAMMDPEEHLPEDAIENDSSSS